MSPKNGKIHEKQNIQLALLHEKVSRIEVWIQSMEENHLPHLEDRLRRIESKIAYWGGGIAVLTVILNLIVRFF